jgi:hypothetical protein
MKITINLEIIAAFFSIAILLSSCKQKEYIIPVDIQAFYMDNKTSETEREAEEKNRKIFGALIENTVEKHLPSTEVFSLSGEKYDLAELVKGKTIIISSDPYCAAGVASIIEDFPFLKKKLHKEFEDVNIICLAIREEEDDYFKRLLSDLQNHYDEVYIIDNEQALSINMVGASQYFLNKEGIVKKIVFGMAIDRNYLVSVYLNGLQLIK